MSARLHVANDASVFDVWHATLTEAHVPPFMLTVEVRDKVLYMGLDTGVSVSVMAGELL